MWWGDGPPASPQDQGGDLVGPVAGLIAGGVAQRRAGRVGDQHRDHQPDHDVDHGLGQQHRERPAGQDRQHRNPLAVVLHALWDGIGTLPAYAVLAVVSLGVLWWTAHRPIRTGVPA